MTKLHQSFYKKEHMGQESLWVLTCFTLACSIQVVVGAQEFALAIGATVIDAGGQVRAKIHLSCYISTHFKPIQEHGDDAKEF